jgi:hypothetical protein
MKIWTLASVLVLVAAAGFAQAPNAPPASLAGIFSPSPAAGSCPLTQAQPSFAASRHPIAAKQAYCWVNCGPYTIACTGLTCYAVDRSCPSTQGYISCDGVTTYCPACQCSEGTTRYLWDGSSCCSEGGKAKDEQVCVNGTWQYSGNSICAGPCGPRVPQPPL